MGELRNPFGVREDVIVLIEDLSASERGLKCECKCPACNGDFIARLGDVVVHHFAHSKDACDEVLAYTIGLYKLIYQILSSGRPFYVPALVVSCVAPFNIVVTENNIASYAKIISEDDSVANKFIVSDGRDIIFENIEFCYDSKDRIEALKLTYRDSKMAIKVKPPDTVCKTFEISPYENLSTLVLDFSDDADMIQTSNSMMFQNYLLSEKLKKYWISNSKVKKAYPQLLKLREKAPRKHIKYQKQLEKIEKTFKPNIHKQIAEPENLEILTIGYNQVKDKFTQQTEQIRDSYNYRWVKCELCGEIKRETEFASYGGTNHVNLGQCSVCCKRDRS